MWNSHALVIDDKFNDGLLICSRLIDRLVPHYFFHYEPNRFEELIKSPKNLSGIRLVFQDLQLISAGAPQKIDFDAAADTLNALIHDTNGPWLLVTWSTWAGEGNDLGVGKAEELFNHLQEELPEGKKPFAYVVLDTKPTFTTGDHHSPVDNLQNISEEERQALSHHIDMKIAGFNATRILISWENEVSRAVSETISDVTKIIQIGDNFDSDLGSILREMATAEIGKHTAPDNFSKGIKEILSSILRDKIQATAQGLHEFGNVDSTRLINWKEKINRIIHLELCPSIRPFPPGSIFAMTNHLKLLPEPTGDAKEVNKFIRANFLDFTKEENNLKEEVSSACTIVAMDITPPCDHANNKAQWNKYIVGIKIPTSLRNFSCMIERRRNDQGERTETRIPSEACGDYIIRLPNMVDGENSEFLFVFNSKLTFSLKTSQAEQTLGECYIGRLREQILSDLTSWLIRQTTRPGIVELR